MNDQEPNPVKVAGAHAAYTMIRSAPPAPRTGLTRADWEQAEIAFQEVVGTQWRQVTTDHGDIAGTIAVLLAVARIAAALSDQLAGQEGRSREAFLDESALVTFTAAQAQVDQFRSDGDPA